MVPDYGKVYQVALFAVDRKFTNDERGFAYNYFDTVRFELVD